jgi:peptide/nickel transport system permease protein
MHRTWLVTFILAAFYAKPLVVAVVVVNFILIKAAPGDPVTVLIGDHPATQDHIDQSARPDQPLHAAAAYPSEGEGQRASLSQHQPVAACCLDRLGRR